jgi:CrcB protein
MREPSAPVEAGVDVPACAAGVGRPREWLVLLVISVGGAAGALARYGLTVALPHAPGTFAWSTFVVNVSGCLLIGALMVAITEVWRAHPLVRPLLGVGVLGGYTTFSAYIIDVQQLVAAGAPTLALAYLAGTALAALAATWCGMKAARLLLRSATQAAEADEATSGGAGGTGSGVRR